MTISFRKFTWQEVEQIVDDLAVAIKDAHFEAICPIYRGGLVPACMLSHRLDMPICQPRLAYLCKSVVLIDDIIDTGQTLVQEYTHLQKRIDVSVFVLALAYKPQSKHILELVHHAHTTSLLQTGQEVPDRYWAIFPWEDEAKETYIAERRLS